MINLEDNILVTGGTGFLGKYILEALLAAGFVNILVISSKDKTEFEAPEGVQLQQCNLLDISHLSEIISKTDVVIHAAAFISFNKRDYKNLLAVNVEGSENIANLCIEHGVKKLIHISSTAALPLNEGEDLVSEENRFLDRNFLSTYGMSKYMAESHIWRAAAEGLDVCILSPALILGVGNWEKGTPGFFKRIHNSLDYYPTGGNGVVYAKDVADFIVLILKHTTDYQLYILSAENISYQDLFSRIALALNKPTPKKAIAGKYLFMARLIDLFNRFTGKESYLNSESIKNISATRSYDNSRSKGLANFKYTDTDDMISEIAKAYLKN